MGCTTAQIKQMGMDTSGKITDAADKKQKKRTPLGSVVNERKTRHALADRQETVANSRLVGKILGPRDDQG